MQIQKVQNNNNNNVQFNGLYNKLTDIDHAKKFLDPAWNGLKKVAEYCDIYVTEATIPIQRVGDATIGHPAIKLTVTPLKGDKIIFFLKHIFRGEPRKVSTQVAIKALGADKKAELLPAAAKTAAEDLYGRELSSVLG